MPKYTISYDLTSTFIVDVEADTEAEALQMLYDSPSPAMNVAEKDPHFMQEDITFAVVSKIETE